MQFKEPKNVESDFRIGMKREKTNLGEKDEKRLDCQLTQGDSFNLITQNNQEHMKKSNFSNWGEEEQKKESS